MKGEKGVEDEWDIERRHNRETARLDLSKIRFGGGTCIMLFIWACSVSNIKTYKIVTQKFVFDYSGYMIPQILTFHCRENTD